MAKTNGVHRITGLVVFLTYVRTYLWHTLVIHIIVRVGSSHIYVCSLISHFAKVIRLKLTTFSVLSPWVVDLFIFLLLANMGRSCACIPIKWLLTFGVDCYCYIVLLSVYYLLTGKSRWSAKPRMHTPTYVAWLPVYTYSGMAEQMEHRHTAIYLFLSRLLTHKLHRRLCYLYIIVLLCPVKQAVSLDVLLIRES